MTVSRSMLRQYSVASEGLSYTINIYSWKQEMAAIEVLLPAKARCWLDTLLSDSVKQSQCSFLQHHLTASY